MPSKVHTRKKQVKMTKDEIKEFRDIHDNEIVQLNEAEEKKVQDKIDAAEKTADQSRQEAVDVSFKIKEITDELFAAYKQKRAELVEAINKEEADLKKEQEAEIQKLLDDREKKWAEERRQLEEQVSKEVLEMAPIAEGVLYMAQVQGEEGPEDSKKTRHMVIGAEEQQVMEAAQNLKIDGQKEMAEEEQAVAERRKELAKKYKIKEETLKNWMAGNEKDVVQDQKEADELNAFMNNQRLDAFGRAKDPSQEYQDIQTAITAYRKALKDHQNLGKGYDQIKKSVEDIQTKLKDVVAAAGTYIQERDKWHIWTKSGRDRMALARNVLSLANERITDLGQYVRGVEEQERNYKFFRDKTLKRKLENFDEEKDFERRNDWAPGERDTKAKYNEKIKALGPKQEKLQEELYQKYKAELDEKTKDLNALYHKLDEKAMADKKALKQAQQEKPVFHKFNKYENLSVSKAESITITMDELKTQLAEKILADAKEKDPEGYAMISKNMSEEKMLELTKSSDGVKKMVQKEIESGKVKISDAKENAKENKQKEKEVKSIEKSEGPSFKI